MVKVRVLLCLSLLLVPLCSVNAVYVTMLHFQNKVTPSEKSEPTDIFVLADISLDPYSDDRLCEIDCNQSKQLIESLKQGAISNKCSAVIVDAALDEAVRAAHYFNQILPFTENIQLGVHTTQAFFGVRHLGKWGSVAYFHSNIARNGFLDIIRTFEFIEGILKRYKFKDTGQTISLFHTSSEQDQKKDRILKCFNPFIKSQLKNFTPNTTVEQLMDEVKKLTGFRFELDDLEDLKGKLFIEEAFSFLMSHCPLDNKEEMQKIKATKVFNFIWSIFEKKPLSELQHAASYWVYPLQRYLALRGMKFTIEKVLEEHKTVIISCNHNKIVDLKNYLYERRFVIKNRCDSKSSANSIIFCNFLDRYRMKVPPNHDIHTCHGCYAVESKDDQFKEYEKMPGCWVCSKCIKLKNIVGT